MPSETPETAENAATAQTCPSSALPAAVLWDLDGTLIDSEPYWIAEEKALVAEHGGVWNDDQAKRMVGNPLLVTADILRTEGGVAMEPDALVERLIGGVVDRVRHALPWRPGARELLYELIAAHVPCALVTMSWRPLADAVLTALPKGTFAAVVTGDAVTRGKPHPEAYLRAAALLGVEPAACVAIEDSPTGAASAVAAGTRAIAVPHVVPVPAGPGLTVLDTLSGVHARDLLRLTAR